MAKRNRTTQFASNESPNGEPRWTRTRIAWVAVAAIAAAGSLVFGIIAMDESALRSAEDAFEQSKFRIAKIELEHFLNKRPNHPQAQVLYARTLVQLGEKPELALEIFDRFEAATPEEMHDWARANFLLERWSSGVPLVEQVVRVQPRNEDALYELTSALLRMREFEKAREPAQKYLDVTQNKAMGHLMLATIASNLNDTAKAVEEAAKVVEESPEAKNLQVQPHEFFAFYASNLLTNGDAEAAEKMAERSIAAERNTSAFLTLGEALMQNGKEDLARQAYREAVIMDPDNSKARIELAEIELLDNQPSDALIWLKRMLAAEQYNSEVAYLVERCYRKLDDKQKIEEWSEKRKELQVLEEKISRLDELAINYPTLFESLLYKMWQFAREGNWQEADVIRQSLEGRPDEYASEFRDQLIAAVAAKDLDQLPELGDFAFRPE